MKRIVICCDGTWNSSDQTDARTNVQKLWDFVREADDQGVPQARRYYPGVGTRWGEWLRGGALGWGLSWNVTEAYRECVALFEPGDQLFLFGFSRGAYTARSLAGLIRNSGIVRREHPDQLDAAYELYRDRKETSRPRRHEAVEFRQRYSHETRITFIGVWDTVGSLGIPKIGMGIVNALFRDRWNFHDVDLSTTVDFAYQALAIDERRGLFSPTVWKQQPNVQNQTLEQVWFAGVHSDVGGGYPESGLSDIPLLWMLDRAAACSLAFDWDLIKQRLKPNPSGPLHDSVSGFYKFLDGAARLIRIERGQTRAREIGARKTGQESVVSSAVARLEGMQPPYDAPNLKKFLAGGGKVTPVRLTP